MTGEEIKAYRMERGLSQRALAEEWGISQQRISALEQGLRKNSAVNHPPHYAKGGVECIDAIRASMAPAAFAGFCKGNVLKYLWRYDAKGGVEDLEKAQVYLGWLIKAEIE